jgi:hypothetical protein
LNATVTFPTSLARGTAPTVAVACSKDCLYLVTLERTSDGKPVLATRGALHGSANVRLPDVPFAAGSYRLRVRLVAQASPGPLTTQTSGIIIAS